MGVIKSKRRLSIAVGVVIKSKKRLSVVAGVAIKSKRRLSIVVGDGALDVPNFARMPAFLRRGVPELARML